VISGLGNSPGLTNLLARKGYESMDRPDRIHIAWTGGSDEPVGPANVKHVMHIFEGRTLQWLDGRETWVPCGGGEKVVDFPEPIGRQTVFYTGHAESVSVPRNCKGLSEVTLHGGIRPVWVARLATAFGRLGLTSTHARREAVAKVLAPVMNVFTMGGTANKSVFRIDAYGTHRGKPRHHWYTGVGHIADITSLPLMEGALMVARGEILARGVFAAEAALDPDDFLPRVQRRGVTLAFHEGAKA
jgi:saccharopine dehydrogenase-like NADP-dependent oxidoreductase